MELYHHQPAGTVDRARALRRNATDAEKRLWRALREGSALKWRRQVPVGPYFADFLCHAARLIIEVDGGQHAEAAAYDARRTAFLERQGYRVPRFWNNDVLDTIDGVMAAVEAAAASPSPFPPPAAAGPFPLPQREGSSSLSLRERDESAQPTGVRVSNSTMHSKG